MAGAGKKTSRVNMVLEGEDDRILGGLESALSDGLNHILRGTKTRRTLSFSCRRRYEQQTRTSETKLAAAQRGSNTEA